MTTRDRRSGPPTTSFDEDDLAYQDDLTGLANRRRLTRLFREEFDELLRQHGEVTLIIIDLDFFKEVNDTFGHLTGDAVLCSAAEVLRRHFRERDLLVRYGGDEFVVVLPGAGTSEAASLVDRAREALGAEEFVAVETGAPVDVPVSFSIGLATAPQDGVETGALMRVADGRLYADKRRRKGEPTARGRHWWVAAGLVGVLTVVVGALVSRPPDVPATALEPAPGDSSAAESAAQRELLQQQIQGLQRQLAELTEALGAEAESGRQVVLEGRIAELEATIAMLEAAEEATRPGETAVTEAESPQVDEPPALVAREESRPPVARTPAEPPAPGAGEDETESVEVAESRRTPAVVSPPRLVELPKPRYPNVARAARMEATVELELVVGPDGRVTEAQVVGEPVGFGLDDAAVDAAMRARFEPGTRDGEPIRMRTRISVQFRM